MRKKLLIICLIRTLALPAANYGDLVFSEIMADPEPCVGLPEVEYLELYNRTDQVVSLAGWVYLYDSKSVAFPVSSIQPGGYLVLCSKTNAASFEAGLPVAAFAAFPALANTGKTICLISAEGTLVSCVAYEDDWYPDGFKRKGGWSLECIDTGNLSGTAANWTASVDPAGGTPGRANSVKAINPDTQYPVCSRLYVLSSNRLELHFSKRMQADWLSNSSNFYFRTGSNMVIQVTPDYPGLNSLTLCLSDTLTAGCTYDLIVRNLSDVSGHICPDTSLLLALPLKPDSFDLSLNELMFNPATGGSDYVEIVNRSHRCLDLSDVWLTSYSESGVLNEGCRLAEKPVPCMPGSYWLLSAKADLFGRYTGSDSLSHFLNLAGMPSMPDDAGHLVLLTTAGNKLDDVAYLDDWHFVLMSDKEGVALEKIHPDDASDRRASWTSASSLSGYGTPGYRNSQYRDRSETDDTFLTVDQVWLSPDNDGLNDRICLRLAPPEPGTVSLTLYDLTGRIVRHLLRNQWLGTMDQICWDGTADAGWMVPYGRYILFALYCTPDGKVQKKKLVLSVLL